jgi:hypothetical protein
MGCGADDFITPAEHTLSKFTELCVSALLTYVLYTFYDKGSDLTINVELCNLWQRMVIYTSTEHFS